MLISVIVPIYKVEEYIEQCVSSIVNQSYKNIEIILVDDGSPDSCPLICDKWAKKDNRIKVVHKQNGGIVSARKAGLEVATGKYVMSVDGDDFISDTLVEDVYKCITENNYPEVVAFNCVHHFPDVNVPFNNEYKAGLYQGLELEKIKTELLYNKNAPSYNFSGIIYSLWSKAIKREFMLNFQYGVPNIVSKGDDIAVTAPAIANCSSLYIADLNGYYYRANPNSIMHNFSSKEIDACIVLLDYLFEKLGSNYDNQICVYAFNMCLLFMANAAKCSQTYKEFVSIVKENINEKLFNLVKRAKIYKPTLKDRVAIFLVKNKNYKLIYYYFHNKRDKSF